MNRNCLKVLKSCGVDSGFTESHINDTPAYHTKCSMLNLVWWQKFVFMKMRLLTSIGYGLTQDSTCISSNVTNQILS